MPELTEASKHIMLEESKEGFDIEIVDGRAADVPGGLQRALRAHPRDHPEARRAAESNSVSNFDYWPHLREAERRRPADYGPWNLSADRANAVRKILEEEGLPSANVFQVAGKADTDPLFPDDPYIAANRRVTITLMREAPPVPPDLHP